MYLATPKATDVSKMNTVSTISVHFNDVNDPDVINQANIDSRYCKLDKCKPEFPSKVPTVDVEITESITDLGEMKGDQPLSDELIAPTAVANDGIAEANELVEYQMVITNNQGMPTAEDVVITDPMAQLEAEVDFTTVSTLNVYELDDEGNEVARDYTYVGQTDNIILTEPLRGGEEVYIEYQAYVKGNYGLEQDSQITSVSEVIATDDSVAENNQASSEIAKAAPGLSVAKTVTNDYGVDTDLDGEPDSGIDDQLIEANEEFSYEITITNNQIVSAYDVRLVDDISEIEGLTGEILEYTVGSTNGDISYTDNSDMTNGLIDITFDEVSSGETITVGLRVQADSQLRDVEEIINVATIEDEACTLPISNCEGSVGVNPKTPLVSVTKEVNDSNGNEVAEIGEILTYKLNVTNSGEVSAYDVIVTDVLPEEVANPELISVVDEMNNDVEYTLDSDNNIIISEVEAGSTVTITYNVEVIDVSTEEIINGVTITDPSNPECEPDASACEDEAIIEVGTPEITSEKNVIDEDNIASAGEELTYEIVVTNSSDIDANGVFVQDDLSSAPELDSSTVNDLRVDGNQVDGDITDGIYIDVPANSSVSVTFKVEVITDLTDVEDIENIATVIDPTDPENPQKPSAKIDVEEPVIPEEKEEEEAKVLTTGSSRIVYASLLLVVIILVGLLGVKVRRS